MDRYDGWLKHSCKYFQPLYLGTGVWWPSLWCAVLGRVGSIASSGCRTSDQLCYAVMCCIGPCCAYLRRLAVERRMPWVWKIQVNGSEVCEWLHPCLCVKCRSCSGCIVFSCRQDRGHKEFSIVRKDDCCNSLSERVHVSSLQRVKTDCEKGTVTLM